MIYLDNAATTLRKPPCVVQAVTEALCSLGNSARGTHSGSLDAARTVYSARAKLAALFGCPSAERVVFTANSTQALNMALCGLLEHGDHVISTDLEHNSVLRPLYRLEQERNVALSFVPADRNGQLNYDAFEALVRPETRAVVCTHASNLTGDLVDLSRVGAFARTHGLTLIVDASQTAGVFPIDMTSSGIGILCFTGHKSLMGPQGTGGLGLADGVSLRPWAVGGTGVKTFERFQPEDYPVRLEAGTLNGHGIAGLSAAVDFIQATGMDCIRAHEQALAHRFYEGVRSLPGIRLYGDFFRERAPVVALNLGDYDSAAVADELSETYGIATRPGGHCAPRLHAALGTKEQGAVRFSFSWFNTEAETDEAIRALKELAQ